MSSSLIQIKMEQGIIVLTGVNFTSRNNFANLGFFAKVSVPVKIYNSLNRECTIIELSPRGENNSLCTIASIYMF